jgi:hypothetical protein
MILKAYEIDVAACSPEFEDDQIAGTAKILEILNISQLDVAHLVNRQNNSGEYHIYHTMRC